MSIVGADRSALAASGGETVVFVDETTEVIGASDPTDRFEASSGRLGGA